MLNFCNGKLTFSFYIKDVSKSVPYYEELKPVFSEIFLTEKVTKSKLIFSGNSRYTAILISLTTNSQRY